ncbi:PHP domain-containing protein [Chloroflexota bacterium]
MSKVDLHIHSTASDGRFSPEEIVGKAAELGLTVIALTDHDSIDGIVPALSAGKSFPLLKIIPGVEMSTDVPQGEVHVLGYFIDYTDSKLKTALEGFRNSRQGRAQGMVTKLRNLGVYIDWQRVQEIAGTGSLGRPHIAQALLEKGYITSLKEAFTKYIGRDGPAYVEREKMTPIEAIGLIIRSNGLPVLAHPFTINEPEALIAEMKAAGLIGIETYNNGYTAEEIGNMVSLAGKYNLITTGGSDYHGQDDGDETLMGGAGVPLESAERLMALAEQRGLKSVNLSIL